MKEKLVSIILISLIALFALSLPTDKSEYGEQGLRRLMLRQQVLAFAEKHSGQTVLVVSKKDHLLFFCRDGKIVENETWNGFTYNFPVKTALASRYYWTPEGEMYVDGKNPYSQYILFLSLSYPGAYGIHSAPTKYKSYLERMEKKFPQFEFATKKDDTRGCIQVENRIIKYLYANVDVRTPVLVMP